MVALAGAMIASRAEAQSFQPLVAPLPSQVIPRNIAPLPPSQTAPLLHKPDALAQAEPVDPALAVDSGDVQIDGAFSQMADVNAKLVAAIAHRHVPLAQLYAAARMLEQAYARRGYILARVVIPPQRLEPGATVKVLVIDGFVEAVDVSHLAVATRVSVSARLQPLVGKRHVTQAAIERALLLAGDLAGARLRSAIAPGNSTGAVRLVVEGEFTRVEGQIGTDNSLPSSLGRWQFTGNFALNAPLGRGDQLYVSLGSQADVGRYGFPKSALGMIGVGYAIPVDDHGTTLTGELLNSRTQPAMQAGVPQSVGEFTRGLVRLSIAAIRTRSEVLRIGSEFNIITQSEKFPQFQFQVSRDHYLAWRTSVNWQHNPGPAALSFNAVLSQGLGGREVSAALPSSRQGAAADFTNFEATAHGTFPLPSGFALDLTTRGKTGFGRPQFVPEQFALDAANGVSSFPGGSFNVDSGVSSRAELNYPPLRLGRRLAIAPYLFGDGGWGWVVRPTIAEQGYVTAGSAGLGGRAYLWPLWFAAGSEATVSVELGKQFSNVAGRTNGRRASLTAAVKF
jgi:hemolysin activation/secretion protein